MARPRSPLTNLVLTLPIDLPTNEVLARAKAKGIAADSKAVWKARQKMRDGTLIATPKAPASNTRAAGAKTPAIKTPAATAAPASKSEFIRSQPASMSATDVVARAKSSGITFNKAYVYRIRGLTKGKRAAARPSAVAKSAPPQTSTSTRSNGRAVTTPTRAPVARTVPERAAPAVQRPISTPTRAEGLLMAVAAEIGLGRAIEILSGERARVRAMIGG